MGYVLALTSFCESKLLIFSKEVDLLLEQSLLDEPDRLLI